MEKIIVWRSLNHHAHVVTGSLGIYHANIFLLCLLTIPSGIGIVYLLANWAVPYLSTDHVVAVANYFQPSVEAILQNEPRDSEVTTLPTLPENKVRNNVEHNSLKSYYTKIVSPLNRSVQSHFKYQTSLVSFLCHVTFHILLKALMLNRFSFSWSCRFDCPHE